MITLLKFIKKLIIHIIDWVLFTVLTERQRNFLKNRLSSTQKEAIKSIMHIGKRQSSKEKIKRITYKLYTLGFTKRALQELKQIANNPYEDRFIRNLAMWELALWHANKHCPEEATIALDYVNQLEKSKLNKVFQRKLSIIKADCLILQNKINEAKQIITESLNKTEHIDLYFMMVNVQTTVDKRLSWINSIMKKFNKSPLQLSEDSDKHSYDRLRSFPKTKAVNEGVKVSIIVPTFNAADYIGTAIESLLTQSWTNLEVIVVDDCSNDHTVEVVKAYQAKDDRVILLQTENNSGAYVARNIGVKHATGDFVTVNDADDWSHCDKIKTQAEHLIDHPHIIANTSQQARLTNDLTFHRRNRPGNFLFPNMSSLMFRRQEVMNTIGYWDSVRFAGDSEFLKRLTKAFGEDAIAKLQTPPLSFTRQSSKSLTGSSAFGYPGYFMGVRKEYAEVNDYYHERGNLKYNFPQKNRPFAVPEPMLPDRSQEKPRHFDVIIASEFRLLGGTNMSNIEEIKAHKEHGLKTGLIQMYRYDLNSVNTINPKVREQIDGETVQMLVYGEEVSCDTLIVRHPPILQDWQKYLPKVNAKQVRVIVNQTPKRDYNEDGETIYTLEQCVTHLKEYFGQTGIWHPIGPLIRQSLYDYHEDELKYINLSDHDWVNIINTKEWQRKERPNNKKITIGRHSRDQYVKWPQTKEELLKVYPNSNDINVHILGGAEWPKKLLGNIPTNWHVIEFGDESPKEFLSKLDLFVYYNAPNWVEAFGRVIFEAMAVGVPVIIPPHFKSLFGEAAIYAEPHEVRTTIEELMNDDEQYEQQVKTAINFVEKHFGYSKHISRLKGDF